MKSIKVSHYSDKYIKRDNYFKYIGGNRAGGKKKNHFRVSAHLPSSIYIQIDAYACEFV